MYYSSLLLLFSITLLSLSSIIAVVNSHSSSPSLAEKIRYDNIRVDLDANIKFSFDNTVLNGTSAWITISWTGALPASFDDWIAVYLHEQIKDTVTTTDNNDNNDNNNDQPSFTNRAPIKFFPVFMVGLDVYNGQGYINLQLLNMKQDYYFVFMRNGYDHPIVSAISSPIKFSNYNLPIFPRLSLTNNNNEMAITWSSNLDATTATKLQYVEYGLESGNYQYHSMISKTTTYNANDLCGQPATTYGYLSPGYFHTAIMNNLLPSTKYYYRVGDKVNGFSSELSFISNPSIESDSSFTFLIYGDMGQYIQDSFVELTSEPSSQNVTTALFEDIITLQPSRQQHLSHLRNKNNNNHDDDDFEHSHPIHQHHRQFYPHHYNHGDNDYEQIDDQNEDQSLLVLHIGDISYARGYAAEWEQFHYQLLPITSRVPYMVSPGNHEYDFPNSSSVFHGHDSGGECGVPLYRRYSMPSASETKPWYSMNYGSVHFIMLSTEHNFNVSSDQYNFLENDLMNVDRTKTPWVIVTGHRPMYISSLNWRAEDGDQTVAQQLREQIEPLIMKYNVNAFIQGHHHSYQRSCPVYQEVCQAEGSAPVQIVVGTAGYASSRDILADAPSWLQYVNIDEHGYVRATVDKDNIKFEFVAGPERFIRDTYILGPHRN